MPTIIKGQPTSKEVIAKLKALNEPVLLAFSCGKDSIAAWIALEDAGIEVVPCYLYVVPHMQFVDDSIKYFERVFNKKIYQYPHPSAYEILNSYVSQAPQRIPVIYSASLITFSYEEMWKLIKEDLNLPADTWVADGVRAADSIHRRASFVRYGVMKERSRKVSPIADWLKAEVMGAINSRGIELPVDYEMFGRSFDGIDARFIIPLKERFPEDFKLLLEWFPMLETVFLREAERDG